MFRLSQGKEFIKIAWSDYTTGKQTMIEIDSMVCQSNGRKECHWSPYLDLEKPI